MSSTTISRRSMLTSTEVRHFEGKIKSMNKLLLHPAAKNSQLTKIVKHLKTHFTEILAYKDHDFNHGKKSVLDMKVKLCGILENVLIQVVIQGKDFDEVIIVESQKPKAAFLHLFGNKNSINF